MSLLNKKILVTGGLSFIGYNLCILLRQKFSKYSDFVPTDKFILYDKFSPESNLNEHEFPIMYGNILDEQLLLKTLVDSEIDVIFHLAAETHVDKSIQNPDVFVENNILGTFVVLKTCLKYQRINPNFKLIEINTDEVFSDVKSQEDKGFTEETQFKPNNPYSASKASATLLARAYHETFGLNLISTHCGNNYGPYQDISKFIPKIITNAIKGKQIPIYGEGKNFREWVNVQDHNEALIFLAEHGKNGERYNIGSSEIRTNNEVVHIITDILENEYNIKCKNLITYVPDRPRHDFGYKIDTTKIQNLGWKPTVIFEEGIKKTIAFYLKK